ncbi:MULTISPECIES: DUF4105 domain-containing protein [Moraxella]|uniref:Putative outermembrane protein n=1 Tax=Moraxella catarrhalis TaxID=480 RepID=A0A7Z0UWL3_MORCA|nr:DUF4105 domain-containing protein [Moraxella catarrhalis]OAU98786.1 putative outermembrane protein [Moraxella catarrhalis]STY81399.1 Uncharacterised protein [Moraxella catarrhalis]
MKHTTKLSAISSGIFILPFVMSLPSYAANTITDAAQIKPNAVSRQDGFVDTKADQMMNPYGLSDKALQSISQSVGWRRLLLFQDTPVEHDNSSIDNPKFFLAQNGRHDAHAELIATLSAMQRGDSDAICRFVARTHFLTQVLAAQDIDSGIDDRQCSDFHAFAGTLNAKRLSLIFAEEHPNNIASAFAHVLMRVDDGQDEDKAATAINYTVQPNKADGVLVSTAKSIIGGYLGVMEIMPYQKKADDYLVKDERDLWQFSLNLTPKEVTQIVRHIWEVKEMKRPYFFTHDNCATEIVRLIDVVRPKGHVQADIGNVVIPSRIAAILSQAGMVTDQKFIPSNSTIRQAKLNNGEDFDIDHIVPSRNNPVHSMPVHRIGVGAGMDTRLDDRAVYGIQLNTAYQDWLDNPHGVRPLLDLQAMSLEVIADDQKVKIKDFTIFSTRSLNPANTAKNNATAKKGVGQASALRVGLTQVIDASNEANNDHLVFDVQIKKGKAWNFGQPRPGSGEIADTTCYALAGGGVQAGRINQGYRIGLGADLGCVHYATDRLRGLVEVSLPYYYHSDDAPGMRSGYLQPALSVGIQADIAPYHAVRLTAQREKLNSDYITQAMLSVQRYF